MNLRKKHLVPVYLDLIYNLPYAQWLLLSIVTPNIITHADKDRKPSFLHGEETEPRKIMYISLQTVPQPLTENNVENFIYVSSIEQNSK